MAAKGSSSSTPITAVILSVAVAIVAAISYKSYQSKKPSRDDEEENKNANANALEECDEHTDDVIEERKDRSTSDATPLTSNVHKDVEHNVSVEGKEVVVDSASAKEEHINETNPTTPKQKKKKKKIRPKLTPTSSTTPTEDIDNTAEDDLGFGDIATSSNSPKLLKKTITKLRPTPQKKQQNSTQGTTVNNNNAPPNVEEGANYNSLSSYWKNQDREHKFVAPVDSSASLPTSSLSKRINASSSANSLVVDTKKKNVCSSGSGDVDTMQVVEESKKKNDEGVKEVEEVIKVDKDEVVPKALEKEDVDVTEAKDSVVKEEKIESIEATGEDEVPTISSSSPTPDLDSKEDLVETAQQVTKAGADEDIVADTVAQGNQEMVESKTNEEIKSVEQEEAAKEVEEKVSSIDTTPDSNEEDQQLIIPSPTTSEDESSSSNQQLIVPSATTSENESSSDKDDPDGGGDGSSNNSSSQEFVKIYKSPSNDVLTESEFLSRDVTTTETEGEVDMQEKEEIDATVPQLDEAGSTDTADVQSSPNKDDSLEKEKEVEVAADDTNKEESSANPDIKKNNNRKRNNNNKKKKKGKGKKRR